MASRRMGTGETFLTRHIGKKKTEKNTKVAPFGIPGVITEPEDNFRVNLIVESKIVFFWKSTGNVTNQSYRDK